VSVRRLLFWCHLGVGMTVGLVMLFLAVTGALMSFQSQITSWSERSLAVSAPSSACVSFASLAEKARQETAKPAMSLTVYSDAHWPALYTVSNDTVYLIDPCTGALLEPGPSHVRAFFSHVKDLHRWVAFAGARHESLRAFKNAINLLFVFLILSGLILWLPRQWRAANLRAISSARPGLKGRAREWNLHHVAGLWFSIPLLAISLSGTIMGYGWANGLLYRAAGSPAPKVAEEHVSEEPARDLSFLDSLIPIAKAQDRNWKILAVRLPKDSDKAVHFMIDDRLDNQPTARNLLTLSRKGKVLQWEPFDSLAKGRQWRLYVRFLHSGELFGVPGQLIVLLSVVALMLSVWTGFSLSVRRLFAWRRRTVRDANESACLKAV
jgi:uncharacterized iron-regulated membrane protein